MYNSLQCFLSLFLIFSTSLTATKFNFPRLNPSGVHVNDPTTISMPLTEDLKTFYYNQTLDHFNYRPDSYTTFPQRYLINFKYWAGANAPIFVYLGAEAPIDNSTTNIGFLNENAGSFNALIVYIEHQYYGQSVSFGSLEEAYKDASTLGYFNSAQAIADYTEIILHIKKKYQAKNSPVIVIGGSYGGMLASWLRLKYPHIALGALASSAPILYFDDITPESGYYSIVTKNFRENSETCYETIKNSWSKIDKVASLPNGLSILSERFNTCKPLSKSYELKNYLESIYIYVGQYNAPPSYPVTTVCGGIDAAYFGSDILSTIYGGVVAYKGNLPCYVNSQANLLSETNTHGWPRPHWITTYYGGHDKKLVPQRFGSNIIFSNGLSDPYSIAGVLENISDSLVALYTIKGSHCLDLHCANETDPE
ncbi:Lysosomal Pro-X carboxypeptidase [Quillaja saponaria]|uniref:Lysosomal Pro-X carboxypeptidase n=1 Tax=Quillaja saponaria TaxID=32244 RepID=A0AAD7VMH3_QUISA|nr:Lysosomal Pro-X carboxypeptidase [Quillaja saponaria]